ncbi:cation:proton antiporter [Candidatus Woesearchaeota archaeon]|nr:cation:proton antiporter [Candidatus Woesearchaeota archaeon]
MPQSSLTLIVIVLTVSLIMSELFYRLKYPRVIGQLVTGILFSFPLFKAFLTQDFLLDIKFLSDMGIVFLLLLAGMEIDLKKFKKSEKDSVIIAVSCALLPFLLGVVLMKLLGFSNIIAVVVGASLALTAEGTKLIVLLEMKALRTRVGTIMVEAGILDDIFEIGFLALVLLLANGTAQEVSVFPLKLIFFIVIVVATYLYLPKLLRLIHKEHNPVAVFSTVLVIGLIIALVSEQFGLGPIIGAFIAGIIIQIADKDKKEEHTIVNELKILTFALVIPFFFLNIGLHFDYTAILQNSWFVILVILVATIGKVLGAMAVTPLTDLSLKQTHLIGWGMNSRGAVELIIAEIARSSGIISIKIYSAIVAMTIFTTLIFPIILKKTVQQNRNILK